MARTQRHTRSTASKLAQHRSESGLSLREVMIRMVKTGLPESYVPSTEKLRRMEADLIPEPLFASGDFPVILECLARIYGVSLQAALGHAKIQNTEIYLPWVVGDLREAMGGRVYGVSA